MHAVQMKKNRPGTAITVLSEPSREADILKVLFRETGTLGVRRRVSERVTLERSFVHGHGGGDVDALLRDAPSMVPAATHAPQ
jgi:uncharacterized protein (DUF111 family)